MSYNYNLRRNNENSSGNTLLCPPRSALKPFDNENRPFTG